jgi:2-iminobutanoate/2-iminopropanoate deaminase
MRKFYQLSAMLVTGILAFTLANAHVLTPKTPSPQYYRAAVKAGNILFVSGQNAQKGNEQLTGDITQQTNIALHYLATTLRSHGYGFKDVVDVTVAMAKQSDFAAFNKAYQHYFPNRPARSTALGVLHQDKGVLVEISLVAYK